MIEKIDADIDNNSVLQLEGPICFRVSGLVPTIHFLNQLETTFLPEFLKTRVGDCEKLMIQRS